MTSNADETTTLSVYIPQDKLDLHPIERIQKLAEQRERSVNYVVIEAILQYLDREMPLAEAPVQPIIKQKDPSRKAAKPAQKKSHVEMTPEVQREISKEANHCESEAAKAVHAYAVKIAQEINQGGGPSYVQWNDRGDKIQVAISRAFPSKNARMGVSLEQWRNLFRPAISEELVKLGWEIRGGNWFWRANAAKSGNEKPRRTTSASSSNSQRSTQSKSPSGCLGIVSCSLGCTLLLILPLVSAISYIELSSIVGPIAVGLILIRN
jgi:hypothetical protein